MTSFAINALKLGGIREGWVKAIGEESDMPSPVELVQPIRYAREKRQRNTGGQIAKGVRLEESDPGDQPYEVSDGDSVEEVPIDRALDGDSRRRGPGRPRKDGTTRADDMAIGRDGAPLTNQAKRRDKAQKRLRLIRQNQELVAAKWQNIPDVDWVATAAAGTRQAKYQLQAKRIAEKWTPAFTRNDILLALGEVSGSGEKSKIAAMATLEEKLLAKCVAGTPFDVQVVDGPGKRVKDVLRELLNAERQASLPLLAVVEDHASKITMENVLDWWQDPNNDSQPQRFDDESTTQPILAWDGREQADKESPRASTLGEMRDIFLKGSGDPVYPISFFELENNTPFKLLPPQLVGLDLRCALIKIEGDEGASRCRQREFLTFSEKGCWTPKRRNAMGPCTALWPASGDSTLVFTAAADASDGERAMRLPDWTGNPCHTRNRAIRLADGEGIFIQPPGFGYAVYTNANSMLAGVHFYTAASFHLSILAIADDVFSGALTGVESFNEDWDTVNKICRRLGDDRLFTKAEQSRNALAACTVAERSKLVGRSREDKRLLKADAFAFIHNLKAFRSEWEDREEDWDKHDSIKRRGHRGEAAGGKDFLV